MAAGAEIQSKAMPTITFASIAIFIILPMEMLKVLCAYFQYRKWMLKLSEHQYHGPLLREHRDVTQQVVKAS
jgi:hypothetical protein